MREGAPRVDEKLHQLTRFFVEDFEKKEEIRRRKVRDFCHFESRKSVVILIFTYITIITPTSRSEGICNDSIFFLRYIYVKRREREDCPYEQRGPPLAFFSFFFKTFSLKTCL